MVQRILIGEDEYNVDKLSNQGRKNIASLKFVDEKLIELRETQAVFERARVNLVTGLKNEMLSVKAGMFFEKE